MRVYHVCAINSQAYSIVSYRSAKPFLYQTCLTFSFCKYMYVESLRYLNHRRQFNTRVYKYMYVKEGLFATLNVIQTVDNQNVVFMKQHLEF